MTIIHPLTNVCICRLHIDACAHIWLYNPNFKWEAAISNENPGLTSSLDSLPECRFDVLLKADQPSRTYYVTSNTQYRAGSPNGYGFLRYADANASQLPPTATPQPQGVEPWTDMYASQVPTCSLKDNAVRYITLPRRCQQFF